MKTVREHLSELADAIDNNLNSSQSSKASSSVISGPRKYRNEIREYNIGGAVDSIDVNAITFVNRGTNTASVNGFVLQTGESVAFEGLAGEIDATNYLVAFGNAGASYTNSLVVFSKKY